MTLGFLSGTKAHPTQCGPTWNRGEPVGQVGGPEGVPEAPRIQRNQRSPRPLLEFQGYAHPALVGGPGHGERRPDDLERLANWPLGDAEAETPLGQTA